jgi:hypothetical protein
MPTCTSRRVVASKTPTKTSVGVEVQFHGHGFFDAIATAVIMIRRSELDEFLRRGPANGDIAQGLTELRYRILTDGIPSNPDGMVHSPDIHLQYSKVDL